MPDGATAALTIRLEPVDETEVLPAHGSVRHLLYTSVERGRCELLPAAERRASAWNPRWVGRWAGVSRPDDWQPDPVVQLTPVQLFRVRNAFYVPAYGVVISAAGEVMKRSMEEAAYTTPDLLALPHVAKAGDGTYLTPPGNVTSLARAAVTMPWGGVTNYGHFVLDCLTGAALLRDLDELADYPLVFPPLQDWQRRHLELLGADAVELDEAVYRVDDLVFPSCMAHFLHTPNLGYRTVRERQLSARSARSSRFGTQIYISRRGRTNRVMRCEQELEERLRDLGFTIVLPEHHSVDEQIEMFQGASTVVGSTGAAMANVLYCHPGASVFELRTPLMPSPWLRSLCVLIGCQWRPYFCADVQLGPPREAGGVVRPAASFSYDVDLDALIQFIGTAG